MSARIVCSGTRPSEYASERDISVPPRRPPHWMRMPGVRELAHDVLANLDVLDEVTRELLLARVPVRLPVVDDADAHPAGMNFLAHYSSLSCPFAASGCSTAAVSVSAAAGRLLVSPS